LNVEKVAETLVLLIRCYPGNVVEK